MIGSVSLHMMDHKDLSVNMKVKPREEAYSWYCKVAFMGKGVTDREMEIFIMISLEMVRHQVTSITPVIRETIVIKNKGRAFRSDYVNRFWKVAIRKLYGEDMGMVLPLPMLMHLTEVYHADRIVIAQSVK